jgi:hypothetical protein
MNRQSNISFALGLNGFKKITPVRGFDKKNRDNARQNNYVWSMAEMGDYIYVGTARNIVHSLLRFISEMVGEEIPVPPELQPINVDDSGEIWRYHKSGRFGWERVYKAPPEPMNIGFRFMKRYTSPAGETALYAAALTPLNPELLILKSADGEHWYPLESGITGYSARYMAEHKGKLYMGALPFLGLGETLLYVSEDPEGEGWQLIDVNGVPGKNPRGSIDLILSYNDRLYVGTVQSNGFEIWRTLGELPEKDNWKLVVDQGAGDARNEHPWAVDFFQEHIYVGSAIEAAVFSAVPEQNIVPPKGFDVIRIDKEDNWELVIGGDPVVPTEPTTGTRGKPIGGYDSGFGNISNAYCWQIQTFGKELYLGTFSWSVLLPAFIPLLPDILKILLAGNTGDKLANTEFNIEEIAEMELFLKRPHIDQFLQYIARLIMKLGYRVFGFDLWKTRDGVHWEAVTLNGLGNPYNYGVRMLFQSEDNKLYLGTANPFQGCEVWVKQRPFRDSDD